MNLLNKVDVYFDTSTSFFGTDYTECTDKWKLNTYKNRVNPCNPCLKEKMFSFQPS